MKGKSLLALIGPTDKGDDESDDDKGEGDETKIDAMRDLIDAIKSNDPEAASAAFTELCEYEKE